MTGSKLAALLSTGFALAVIAAPMQPAGATALRTAQQADASHSATPAVAPRGPASADNVVVTGGPATVRIGHVEVAGSTLSNGDVAALFTTKDPKALAERLGRLDAASIVIPEITADVTNGGTEVHVVQKQVLLADVHGGRAGSGSAATTIVTVKDARGTSTFTIGATTLKGVDLAQAAHLAAGPRTDPDEAMRPLCDEMAAHAVSIAGPDKKAQPVTISSVRETGLKARPFTLAPTGTPTGSDGPAATIADVTRSLAADLVEADDFGLAGGVAASATAGLKSLALKHVALHGLGDGKLARFELNGLAMEGNDAQPGKLALASAVISDVVFASKGMPTLDGIELRELAVDVPTSADAKPQGRFVLAVAHAGYEAPGLVIGRIPREARLSVEHAVFDVPADNPAAPVLLAMGYKHLDLSSESLSHYDAAARTLGLERLSLAGVGMGALDLKLQLADVSEDIASQDDKLQKAAAAAILVRSLDFTLRNDGLIDKALGFKAAVDGITVEQERTNIGQIVGTGLVAFGLQASAKAQMIAAALQKFVADPKTLHIALASRTGLGLANVSQVSDPQALLDALEVKADAD